MSVNVPASVKIYGCALGPDLTRGDYWVVWRDWPWTTLLKPSIDLAVGQCGCNAVHILMSHQAVREGLISLATAQAQLVQLVAYCASFNPPVYVLLRGEDPYHMTHTTGLATTTVTDAAVISFLNSMLTAVAGYSNIIGLDHVAESDGDWGSGGLDSAGRTRCNTIYAGVKNLFPNTALTSTATMQPGDARLPAWLSGFSLDWLGFDAYAFNSWPSPIAYSDIAWMRTAYPNHDLLFVETGIAQNSSVDAQNTFLNGMSALCAQGDSRLKGLFHWQAIDQNDINTLSSDCYGLKAMDGTVRHNKINFLRRATGGTLAARN